MFPNYSSDAKDNCYTDINKIMTVELDLLFYFHGPLLMDLHHSMELHVLESGLCYRTSSYQISLSTLGLPTTMVSIITMNRKDVLHVGNDHELCLLINYITYYYRIYFTFNVLIYSRMSLYIYGYFLLTFIVLMLNLLNWRIHWTRHTADLFVDFYLFFYSSCRLESCRRQLSRIRGPPAVASSRQATFPRILNWWIVWLVQFAFGRIMGEMALTFGLSHDQDSHVSA